MVPLFSIIFSTNVNKTFLKLSQRHFPVRHTMHKIFNGNAVKISYCCMQNMGSGILSDNTQVLNPRKEHFAYSCRVSDECSKNNKYLVLNVGYEARDSNKTSDECKRYLGASETPFKERFRNHTRDFKHKKYDKCTELSKYIWSLKSYGITPVIKWRIVKKVNIKNHRITANYV